MVENEKITDDPIADETVERVLSYDEEQLLKKIFNVKSRIAELRGKVERKEILLKAGKCKLFLSDEVQEISNFNVQRFKLAELEREDMMALSYDKLMLRRAEMYLDLYERCWRLLGYS